MLVFTAFSACRTCGDLQRQGLAKLKCHFSLARPCRKGIIEEIVSFIATVAIIDTMSDINAAGYFPLSTQAANQIQGSDPIVRTDVVPIHRQHDLLIIVRDKTERPEFPLTGFRGQHTFRYLNIQLIIRLFRYKIDLGLSDLPDVDAVIPAEQLQKHDVLNDMPPVRITIAKQQRQGVEYRFAVFGTGCFGWCFLQMGLVWDRKLGEILAGTP